MRAPALTPVTVLTGFLGAGKTTLLNRLLADPRLADTAVVINELGRVGLDHLLVGEAAGEPVLLAGGCLCCALRGDLADTVLMLAARRQAGSLPPFRRLVIETTGLADPAPVLQTLAVHPNLAPWLRLAGVVTVVDAALGLQTLDAHVEAVRQVAMADRLVLGKSDLADPSAVAALRARLAALAPSAPIVRAGEADAALLLAGPGDAMPRHLPPSSPHRFTADGGGIQTLVLATARPLDLAVLEAFLDQLRDRHGPSLLRLKGLVALADDPARPLLVQAVQHILHPPRRLPAWPDADRRTRLVAIVQDGDAEAIGRLFDAFAGRVGVDAPDRQALTDNPLAL